MVVNADKCFQYQLVENGVCVCVCVCVCMSANVPPCMYVPPPSFKVAEARGYSQEAIAPVPVASVAWPGTAAVQNIYLRVNVNLHP